MTDKVEAVVDRLAGGDEDLRKQLLAYGAEIQRDFELDRDLGLLEREVGNADMAAAAKHLRERGVDLETCSQKQLLNALKAVA